MGKPPPILRKRRFHHACAYANCPSAVERICRCWIGLELLIDTGPIELDNACGKNPSTEPSNREHPLRCNLGGIGLSP